MTSRDNKPNTRTEISLGICQNPTVDVVGVIFVKDGEDQGVA